MMNSIRVPSYLHELFGERPHPAHLITILLFGTALTLAWGLYYPESIGQVPLWRAILVLLLIFDLFAGCIANFTASTSNYYAARPRLRIIFIAVHVQLPLIALLLDTAVLHTVAVWGYTKAGAALVNALSGKSYQLLAAGVLLSAGLFWIPMLPSFPSPLLIISLLFMLKVLFSFSVHHYGLTDDNSAVTDTQPS